VNQNFAAVLNDCRRALEVAAAPYPEPSASEVVIRNRAVAVNPVDWMIQGAGNVLYPWLKHPSVIGTDVAGEVVQIGSAVTRFSVGDRVVALAVGTDRDVNQSCQGAFQLYTAVREGLTSPIPDTVRFEDAAVLPLGLATAACALFQSRLLALDPPRANPTPSGKTLLVWGAASSVGSNAVQLGVAAGYDVVATASAKNIDYVRRLGARVVFDHSSPTVVDDLAEALQGVTLAGALAVTVGSAAHCAAVLRRCLGRKFIAMTTGAVAFDQLTEGKSARSQLPALVWRLVPRTSALLIRCALWGIRTRFVIGTSLKSDEVGAMIFENFLPRALSSGAYRPAPNPLVVGDGLQHLQSALETHKRGVSATKIVVTLS
jgi:NADPH:quinone reductase-like Zn-dependent oxidoreductase